MRQKFLELLFESSKTSSTAAASSSIDAAAQTTSGVTLAGFREAYRRKYGDDLPHSKFGFDSVRSMLASLPWLIKLTGG